MREIVGPIDAPSFGGAGFFAGSASSSDHQGNLFGRGDGARPLSNPNSEAGYAVLGVGVKRGRK